MIGAVGDVVEDVVVVLSGPINEASDTDARIARRRGGSAANVAAAAAAAGHRSRFIGHVGTDPLGDTLIAELERTGVEAAVRRGGRTGSIVVLVDSKGERTMLSDRGAAIELAPADRGWLDGLTVLHVPFYSLAVEPLASTCRALISWAKEDGIMVSIDASSVSLIEHRTASATMPLIAGIGPDVMLCNEAEADTLGADLTPQSLGAEVLVVKRGPDPALVKTADGRSLVVPAHRIDGLSDTTGAGDGFAAGFLPAYAAGRGLEDAVQAGHDEARRAIQMNSTAPDSSRHLNQRP